MNQPQNNKSSQPPKHPIVQSFPPEKRSFKEQEASIYLGESCSLLRKKRMKGTLPGRPANPKFIKVGKRSIRYLREDLDAYLNQFRKYDHTHEDGTGDKVVGA